MRNLIFRPFFRVTIDARNHRSRMNLPPLDGANQRPAITRIGGRYVCRVSRLLKRTITLRIVFGGSRKCKIGLLINQQRDNSHFFESYPEKNGWEELQRERRMDNPFQESTSHFRKPRWWCSWYSSVSQFGYYYADYWYNRLLLEGHNSEIASPSLIVIYRLKSLYSEITKYSKSTLEILKDIW